MQPDSAVHSIQIDGLPFIVGTFPEVINRICHNILQKKSQIILPCSLNDLASISSQPKLFASYQKVDICTTDGMPLVWISSLKTKNLNQRVYGPDLMKAIFQKLQKSQARHVLYGATPNTVALLKKKLLHLAPHSQIVETFSPPMRKLSDLEEKKYLSQLKKSRPDVVWIGISSPAQIEQAARWKKALQKTTFICVGAAFDFVSGSKNSAPNWMKKNGFEWFFRLINEPKRLWKRYLYTIPKYLLIHGFRLVFNP